MSVKNVDERKSSDSIIVRGFGYFALFTSSINRIAPRFRITTSILILTCLTSSTNVIMISKTTPQNFLICQINQKIALVFTTKFTQNLYSSIMSEKFLVKLLINNLNKLVNTVFNYIIVCVLGEQNFLCKLLFEQTNILLFVLCNFL